jgi:outer membrane protein TolC
VQPGSVIPLTLGDAGRLAARQSAVAQSARLRSNEAQARVRQRRADLLPTVSSYVQEAGRTFNTSTLGIDFPTPAGQKPIFDPKGQVEGPVNTLDIRGRVQQNLLDFGAIERVRSAQAQARSSNADADATAEQAASVATSAYVRAMRADADLRARAHSLPRRGRLSSHRATRAITRISICCARWRCLSEPTWCWPTRFPRRWPVSRSPTSQA